MPRELSQIIKEGEEVVLEKNCRLTESYEQVRWETLRFRGRSKKLPIKSVAYE